MTLTFESEDQLIEYVRKSPRLKSLVVQPDRAGLTQKQHECLEFICRFRRGHPYPPSFEDIRVGLKLSSKGGAHRLVTALQERGYISMLPNRARSIRVLEAA